MIFMKQAKKILAALLAITLTACGNSGTAEVTDQTTEGTSSVSETVSEELSAESEETTLETKEEETEEEPIDEPVTEKDDLEVEPVTDELELESPDEYKDLYKAFLTDLTSTYGDYDFNEGDEMDADLVCFDLCDIDNDGIPELFVSEGAYHVSTADIYTIANGEVVKLDSKGEFGRILVSEKYIADTYSGMGCINVDIFAKNGNSLEPVVSIKDHSQSIVSDKCYMLNDEIVSEEAMQEELDKYQSMTWYSVGRSYALCTKTINAFFESDVEKAAQITGKYSTSLI